MQSVGLAIVVLALLLVVYMIHNDSEGYTGDGVNNQIFTSGATMRRLGQVFTSTNQGETTTPSNIEIKARLREQGIKI